MTTAPPEPPSSPQPPELERPSVEALIEFATAQSEYCQWWVEFSRSRGQELHEQQIENVAGWAFVAMALRESYDT